MTNNNWTPNWPTEPGLYWHYGWYSKTNQKRKHDPKLIMFEYDGHSRDKDWDYVIANDCTYSRRKFGDGLWLRVEEPDLPVEWLEKIVGNV